MEPWRRWQDWVVLVLGVWTVATPFVFGFAGETAAMNAWVVGVVLAAMGLWALARPAHPAPPIVGFVAGAWLVIGPWEFGFAGEAAVAANAWAVGAVAVVLTAWTLYMIGKRESVEPGEPIEDAQVARSPEAEESEGQPA